MIALMTVRNTPVALEADLIESVEAHDNHNPDNCVITMTSGKEHEIARSYTYVTGILRAHYETH